MNRRVVKSVVTLSFLLVATLVAAEETTTRTYQLPNHGHIQLQVPRSWRAELRQPPGGLPPTIVFFPKTGRDFQILLTPIFSVRQGMIMPSLGDVKKTVERAAEHAKSQAVEKTIAVKELQSSSAVGYYFSVTDRSPKPGEYKYMTQGMLRVGELAPTFTVLTSDGQESVVAESLSMLKGVAHVRRAP